MKKSGIIRYPSFIEVAYKKFLLSLFNDLNKNILNSTINNPYFKSSYSSSIRKDDAAEDIDKILENLKNKFLSKFSVVASELIKTAFNVNNFNLRSVINATPKLVNNTSLLNSKVTDDLSRLWVNENVRLIKSINSRFLDDVASKVYEAVKSGKSITSLAKDLQAAYKTTSYRAKLIAADQIAKFNGVLTKERKLILGLVDYVWVTSNDERVRKSHRVLEGSVCSFENEKVFKRSPEDKKWLKRSSIGGDESHPGLAIRCRCTSYSIYS